MNEAGNGPYPVVLNSLVPFNETLKQVLNLALKQVQGLSISGSKDYAMPVLAQGVVDRRHAEDSTREAMQ